MAWAAERGRGQVQHQRLDLGAQEVVGTRRAQRGQPGVLAARQEVENLGGVGEVPDHRPVQRRDRPDGGHQPGGPLPALRVGQRFVPLEDRAERLGPGVRLDVRRGGLDDPPGVALALLGGLAPRRDPVPAEDRPDRLRVLLLGTRRVQAELEPGPAPRDPHDPVAEDPAGELLAVGRGRDRDAGVRVQVVDVRLVDQGVGGGVDGGGRPTAPVQAVVERGDHLVLAVHAGVDVDQGAQPVHPQDGQAGLAQGAQVPAGALDPEQLDRTSGHRVVPGALRRGVAAGEVRVAGIGSQPVRPGDQLGHQVGRLRVRHRQLHPACVPPTRSASICSW